MEGNRLCSLCRTELTQQFCICSSLPLLCASCRPSHETKPTFHFSLPIEALAYVCPQNQQQYRVWLLNLANSQEKLRENVQEIDKCRGEVETLYALVQAELEKSQVQLLRTLEELKTTLSSAIEEAIRETSTNAYLVNYQPISDLAALVWKNSCQSSSESIPVFTYTVEADNVERMLEYLHISFQTSLPYFQHPQDFKAQIELLKGQLDEETSKVRGNEGESLEGLPHLFAAVDSNSLELYDVQTQQSTLHTLAVDFSDGGSYIPVDTHTLLCLGGVPPTTAVYELDLLSLTFTSLPSLRTPRSYAGVAKAAHTVFVFGGCDDSYNSQKSCEKYGSQWLPLGDMQEGRWYFTPCTFRSLIYLPCPYTTLTIETFSPHTETFTVLPVSFPRNLYGPSVSFVANGELCVLTDSKQMGRWRIESEGEFRLFATDRECGSTQPPLIVNSLVLIANNYSGIVEKFSLEPYSFI